ncbi:nuclear pore complex protein Nup50 [Onthophagus taurus]|uniref:nuclear pore complex protein Nup50 n=1 Tax=Onthophagus taurus TaxID=166361 RepID=UPI0039BE62A0
MAKRTATSELNHFNWDDKEEPEDAGEFKKATSEVLQKRVIKTARRRNPISSNVSETPKSSVFGNFSGFGGKPAPAPSTAFSFLNNLNKEKEKEPPTNGTNMLGVAKVTNNPSFQAYEKKEEDGEFLAKIKALNESVSNWIKSKVDQNPYVDLKPVFKDYEKHFNDLKTKDNKKETSNLDYSTISFKPPEQTDAKEEPKKTPTKPTFVFGIPNQTSDKPQESLFKSPAETSIFKTDKKDDKTETKPTFTFGAPNKGNESKNFSFGMPTSTPMPMFSFGSTPSTSTFTLPTTTNEVEPKNEEDDDEPPTNDFTPVVEEGYVFTMKCKVFVKSDGKFGDRGVGTLYLKPVPDSEKVQLIVRADTSLGKVLCNFILSQSIPTKRMGKKDVMMVTVPTPDSKPPPVPILIRVKSPEEADQLFGELEKQKK